MSRWMRKAPRNPELAKRWAAFLSNYREAIAAMDLLTMPTLTFSVLYCFFVIAHERRHILHFNVTRHPTSAWGIQQLRESFPYDRALGFLIFDRGANFSAEVVEAIKSFRIHPKRTSFQSPWRNGALSVSSALADAICSIMWSPSMSGTGSADFVRSYHDDRTHLGLGKQTPNRRKAALGTTPNVSVVSVLRLGGLHHCYDLAA